MRKFIDTYILYRIDLLRTEASAIRESFYAVDDSNIDQTVRINRRLVEIDFRLKFLIYCMGDYGHSELITNKKYKGIVK